MQTENKPQNGLVGLKHWRYDLGAGVQVALVSLPLSKDMLGAILKLPDSLTRIDMPAMLTGILPGSRSGNR